MGYGCTRNTAKRSIPLHHHRVLYNAHRVVYLKHTHTIQLITPFLRVQWLYEISETCLS